MAHDDRLQFAELIGENFDFGEVSRLERVANGTSLEPIKPGCTELLRVYDGLCEVLLDLDEKAMAHHIDEFLDRVTAICAINPTQRLRIAGIGSFLTRTSSGKLEYKMGQGIDVEGGLDGFILGEWYDIPLGEKPKDPTPYLRLNGLLAVVADAVVLSGDIPLFKPEPGKPTYVPLTHGHPALYRLAAPA